MVQVRAPTGDEAGIETPGSREQFEAFYRREYAAVVALAYALCGRGAVAEDLTQEAFLATYRHWAKVGHYDRPGAYVRHVVANLAISHGRKRAAEARALVGLAGRARSRLDDLESPDAEFWQTVRSLPAKQAQAVALYYLEDRPAEEIAEILRCSVSTVRVHLHRGRVTLEARWRDGRQP